MTLQMPAVPSMTDPGLYDFLQAARRQLGALSDQIAAIPPPVTPTPVPEEVFDQIMAVPGYAKLPGGLIVEWGLEIISAPANGQTMVTMPIPFPNRWLSFSVACYNGSASVITIQGFFPDNATLGIVSAATGVGVSWITLGF